MIPRLSTAATKFTDIFSVELLQNFETNGKNKKRILKKLFDFMLNNH